MDKEERNIDLQISISINGIDTSFYQLIGTDYEANILLTKIKKVITEDDMCDEITNKCIGCDTTKQVEKCEGTMCRDCWDMETNDGLE